MDAPLGFEPKLTVSKTALLPLEEGALVGMVGLEPAFTTPITINGVENRLGYIPLLLKIKLTIYGQNI